MSRRTSENQITAEIILQELHSRNLNAEVFPEWRIPNGKRAEPDVVIYNGQKYVVEAKKGQGAREENQATWKIYDRYIKYHTELQVTGGFALLYPDGLSQIMSAPISLEDKRTRSKAPNLMYRAVGIFADVRQTAHKDGDLSEVLDWIEAIVKQPQMKTETSIPYLIDRLNNTAMLLAQGLRHLQGKKQLDDLFGGEYAFRNVLQFDEGKYPVQNLQDAAGFILLNQLLFYHILSNERKELDLRPLNADEIERAADLQNYFDEAMEATKNYLIIFRYRIAPLLVKEQQMLDVLKEATGAIQGLAPEKIRHDMLGTAFHDVIPPRTRKGLGAYYTNIYAAQLLASLAIEHPHTRVADFACGSGGLLAAAYRRKRRLLESSGLKFTEDHHVQFLEQELLGIDVLSLAVHLTTLNIAFQAPKFLTDKANVAVWDSIVLSPYETIPAFANLDQVYGNLLKQKPRRKMTVGAVSLQGEAFQPITVEKYDAVIMNPPFTRHERIPEDYKTLLMKALEDYKDYVRGQMGYHPYFTFVADRFLKDGGRLALVLPASVLRLKSTKGVRQFLSENYELEYVITNLGRAAFSEETEFREILLLARKNPTRNTVCRFLMLKSIPSSFEEANNLAERIRRKSDVVNGDGAFVAAMSISQDELAKNVDDWYRYIVEMDLPFAEGWDEIVKYGKKKLTHYEELGLKTMEGVESRRGFKIQQMTIHDLEHKHRLGETDVWKLEKEDRNYLVVSHRSIPFARYSIPKKSTARCVCTISGIRSIDLRGWREYVVKDTFSDFMNFMKFGAQPVKKKVSRLQAAEEIPALDNWKKYVEDRISKMIVVRRLDISAPGTSFYGIYCDEPCAPPGVGWGVRNILDDDAKIMTLWLNSTPNILQIILNRVETRGAYMIIHKYVLNSLFMLNLSALSSETKKRLLKVFENVRTERFPDILDQVSTGFEPRRKIDHAILQALGISDDKINEVLQRMYSTVASKIQELKTLMKGK